MDFENFIFQRNSTAGFMQKLAVLFVIQLRGWQNGGRSLR